MTTKIQNLATQTIGMQMGSIDKMINLVESDRDLIPMFERMIKEGMANLSTTITALMEHQSEWQVSAAHDQFNVLKKRVESLHGDEIVERSWWITGSYWKPGTKEPIDESNSTTFAYGPFDTEDEASVAANSIEHMEGAIGSLDGKAMEYEIDDVTDMHYGQACKHFDQTIMSCQTEHVILVGIVVAANDPEKAQDYLISRLPKPEGWYTHAVLAGQAAIDSWWIAEDNSKYRNDMDSATFCKPGKQAKATKCLRANGLAH